MLVCQGQEFVPVLVKQKLLIMELWGLGDLAIATPFLRKASEKFNVTLLAKPFAKDLQPRFWPEVKVIPFNAPWTAFNRKYHLWEWHWGEMFSVWTGLFRERFDVALSARWDPRDHFLMRLTGAKMRLGFPRLGSHFLLTHPLSQPAAAAHRYDYWLQIARALDLDLEIRDLLQFPPPNTCRKIIVHTGAAQPVRVWPLERYRRIVQRLRARGETVQVLCNPEQQDWWNEAGESVVACPRNVGELLHYFDESAVFIGNDSGPGHLAAFCGLPTFTFFGPQVVEWFVPLHPAAEFMEGKACPYKPCSDYCRFAVPHCLWNITEDEAWPKIERFVESHLHHAGRNMLRTAPAGVT